ncbi:MAG: dihydrodipicolinate synthase family protein [Chloroflexi bacterium]|nr:dihydrodipicolinate synthase family protein [Chloroflexota bacterium]
MEAERIREWLMGPMVAVAMPFKEDYSLDLDALQENVRYMIDHGIRTGQGSLLVAAAGGEHPTLNADERKAAMQAALEAAQGEVPVLASIQHTDVRIILDLARHASKVGLQGAQLGPPYYYPPTEGDALRLFQMVAEESDVSIMVYHTHWDGLNMSLDLLRRLAEIPTVRGLKWSAPTDEEYRQGIAALRDDLVIIDNSGRYALGHSLGARGFITHVGGFWPEYTLRIWNLLERGDYDGVEDALADFQKPWSVWTGKVTAVTGGEGPFIKAAMEAMGLRAGPPRPPSVRPPEHLEAEIRELLRSSGVPQAAERAQATA